jgi:hypothetical protein
MQDGEVHANVAQLAGLSAWRRANDPGRIVVGEKRSWRLAKQPTMLDAAGLIATRGHSVRTPGPSFVLLPRRREQRRDRGTMRRRLHIEP